MIELKLDPYCQKCGSFEAETNHETVFCGPEPVEDIFTIGCIRAPACRIIYDHFLSEHSDKNRVSC